MSLDPSVLAKIDQNQAGLHHLVDHVRRHRTRCPVPSCVGPDMFASLEAAQREKVELIAALALYELAALPPPPTTLEEMNA